MKENIVAKLTLKDDKYACALADKIISESQETDESLTKKHIKPLKNHLKAGHGLMDSVKASNYKDF